MSTLPEEMDRGSVIEISFLIERFNALSEEDQRRIAHGIVDEVQNSPAYVSAGVELFQPLLQDVEGLTRHANNLLFGEGTTVITVYMVWLEHAPHKAAKYTKYFRDHLTGITIEPIEVPRPRS